MCPETPEGAQQDGTHRKWLAAGCLSGCRKAGGLRVFVQGRNLGMARIPLQLSDKAEGSVAK